MFNFNKVFEDIYNKIWVKMKGGKKKKRGEYISEIIKK